MSTALNVVFYGAVLDYFTAVRQILRDDAREFPPPSVDPYVVDPQTPQREERPQ